MTKKIAIISASRSALGKAGGVFKNISAAYLGSAIAKQVISQAKIPSNIIDEVIVGNVSQPADTANIARVIAYQAGVPASTPAFTVHRNCASGLEAITSAIYRINSGDAKLILAGGVESMSNIPLIYNKKFTDFFANLIKSKTVAQKIATISKFRLNFLQPIVALTQGLTDPLSGLIMGCTAENLARDFAITREQQDEFALNSHRKAQQATEQGVFDNETSPVFNMDSQKSSIITADEGIRYNQQLGDLAKLKPYFEKNTGTVTVGNSSQITDGAGFLLLASTDFASELQQQYDCQILGYITDFAYAGLDPSRMGLGPVFATQKLLNKTSFTINDFDLIEINEAFAAQVIACTNAFASNAFCQKNFGLNKAIGEINPEILNVNGGAIALGHPVGMSGARIVIHLLHQLKATNKKRGLATLCIGGGQGGSCIVET